MASPNPPPQNPNPTPTPAAATPEQQQQQQQQKPPEHQNPFLHTVALGVTPIALAALFLPPRRLDARQALLGGVAVWGTNQLVYDYSGRSFAQRLGRRVAQATGTELPEKARRTQALLREERERERERERIARLRREGEGEGEGEGELGRTLEEVEKKKKEEKEKKERSTLEAIWMGDQGDDWKAKRDEREKKALSEGGGGYWGLITDQISEVWNQGKKKEQEAQAAEIKAKADMNEGKKKP